MMTSLGDNRGKRPSIVSSTDFPDGTISHTARGGASCPVSAASESAPIPPRSSRSARSPRGDHTPPPDGHPAPDARLCSRPSGPDRSCRSPWSLLPALCFDACALEVVPQLRGILILHDDHAASGRTLEIDRPVIDKNALVRRPLRDLQRQAEDGLLRFLHAQKARTKERHEVTAQAELADPMKVQVERFVV